MAPDINSLPTSPRPDGAGASLPNSQPSSTTASRRTSAMMGPPSHPASATANPRSPVMSSSSSDQVPMRHPRPLTAAELYAECEKEQEAVVNRLTRELTALRAQSASVASNASASSISTNMSASLLPVDISDPNPTHQMVGATHPTPSRRHRSSSSVSSRSIPTPSSSVTNASTQAQAGTSTANVPVHGVSQASADRAAAATGSLSRQPSASGTSTPARQSMEVPRQTLYTLPHRPSVSRDPSSNTISSTHAHAGTPAPISSPASPHQPSSVQAMQHYAETAAYRTEMEIVKAENEALRQRVRALERALRARRRDSSNSDAQGTRSTRSTRESERERVPPVTSPPPTGLGVAAWAGGVGGVAGPRERSESQSTTASSRRGLGTTTDDEVRVGESASSVGMGRGL